MYHILSYITSYHIIPITKLGPLSSPVDAEMREVYQFGFSKRLRSGSELVDCCAASGVNWKQRG